MSFTLPPKEIGATPSSHLNLVRAITAMAVVAGHIRSLFLVEYGSIENPNIFHKLFYFFTGLGHQGVIAFFVLSGLLVGGSVLKIVKENKWSWTEYIAARLSRLYIVLIPGLIITFLFDTIGMALAKNSSIYTGNSLFGNVITFQIIDAQTFKNFWGSLFFLQTIITRPFGSNTPLWSLANEFWYYVLFPFCLFFFLKNGRSILMRLFMGIVATGIFFFIGWNISFLFLVWLLGIVVFILQKNNTSSSKTLHYLFIFLIGLQLFATLSISRFSLIENSMLMDFLLGVSISLFLWGILSLSKKEVSNQYKWLARTGAGFSYTLYVVHLPLVIFIHGIIGSHTNYFLEGRWNPDIPHIAFILTIFLVVLFFAYLVSLFTENKTSLVRRIISDLIKKH
ncbi:MAG: acyltransferase [Candidatus Paceibacterota bacterium]|jgi:peptidoglycan/LPS O-acetylase OafA/YrhL